VATVRATGGPSQTTASLLLIALVSLFAVDAITVRRAQRGRATGTGLAQDRRTYWVIQAGQIAGLAVALFAPRVVPALNIDSFEWFFVSVGLALMVGGIALRVWAVSTLGRFFDRTITVHSEHQVVTAGPYAWVRHPSYTAVLAVFAGFGLAQANWLSLVGAIAFPLAVYVRRIDVEEAALRESLGDEYARYAAGRKRLVPGIY
jgi:protein-S-isoprenylcysteine O-methyltransferase Ste14